MSKEVSLIGVPQELSDESDFGIPVYFSEPLMRRYLSHPWMTNAQRKLWILKILNSTRREIDAWCGENEAYDVDCHLPIAIHDCCNAICTEVAFLKAVYLTEGVDRVTLKFTLADEA